MQRKWHPAASRLRVAILNCDAVLESKGAEVASLLGESAPQHGFIIRITVLFPRSTADLVIILVQHRGYTVTCIKSIHAFGSPPPVAIRENDSVGKKSCFPSSQLQCYSDIGSVRTINVEGVRDGGNRRAWTTGERLHQLPARRPRGRPTVRARPARARHQGGARRAQPGARDAERRGADRADRP